MWGRRRRVATRWGAWLTTVGLLLALLPAPAAAATHTWTGANGLNWSDAGNWTGGAPTVGESNLALVFPGGSTNCGGTNDIVGLTVASISLGNGCGITGNAITLTGGLTSTSSATPDTLDMNVALAGSQTFMVTGWLLVSSVVSGGAGATLTKAGTGTLHLTETNTYAGPTVIAGGQVQLGAAAGLGATSSGTTVRSGAELHLVQSFGSPITVAEPLTLANGSLVTTDVPDLAVDTLTGPITLTGGTATFTTASGTLDITGAIGGGGGLHIGNTVRSVNLGGSASNTFSGPVTVGDLGHLVLAKTGGATAVPSGGLVIDPGASPLVGATAMLGGPDQIADGAPVTVGVQSALDLGDVSDTIGSLALPGGHVNTSFGILTLGGNVTASTGALVFGQLDLGATTRTFTVAGTGTGTPDLGVVATIGGQPGAGLIKAGPGTLGLVLANTYDGPTIVDAGTLLVDGSQPSSVAAVGAGTLGGSGTTGPLWMPGGTLSPGGDPVLIPGSVGSPRPAAAPAVAFSPAILTITGDARLEAGSTYVPELAGTTPGTDYDQLAVTGAVLLEGGTLAPSSDPGIPRGRSFTIIDHRGHGPVQGTFASLPEGASLTAGTKTFRITYRGGDGNDVVLTARPGATTTTTSTTTPSSTRPGTGTPTGTPASGSTTSTGGTALTGTDTAIRLLIALTFAIVGAFLVLAVRVRRPARGSRRSAASRSNG